MGYRLAVRRGFGVLGAHFDFGVEYLFPKVLTKRRGVFLHQIAVRLYLVEDIAGKAMKSLNIETSSKQVAEKIAGFFKMNP